MHNLRFVSGTAAIVLVAISASPALAAGDAARGKEKAAHCKTCHGLDGLSKLPEAPHLAGQNVIYLAKALGDYKSGARKNEVMNVVAGPLSAEDIADLAAYYASIEVKVVAPK